MVLLTVASVARVVVLQWMQGVRARRVSRGLYEHLRHMEFLWSAVQEDVRSAHSRIRDLMDRLNYIEERQDRLDINEMGEQAYRLAIRMARKGASLEDLTGTCGVTRAEAELLALLHKQRRAANVNGRDAA